VKKNRGARNRKNAAQGVKEGIEKGSSEQETSPAGTKQFSPALQRWGTSKQ
jgi:hypothetical protein